MTSLQPILDSLGIDKQVKNMSQAEKEILRYIATLKQAKIAMGDFANTCESPSNQLKIFRQQLIETKVAFSSLFIGGLSSILPYVNAFLMVVKEVSKAIATMFGIELKDYNSGIASQEGIYDGIADSADDASKAVKELKRQTLGFDEIHNINENNNSGSGTSVSGGIDQRLLDAITGYDNGMDKVRMKATEIRDRIMDWLGFTKEIDPLTGEVSFKYNGIKTALKNIWKSFKDLNTQGKIFVGLGLYLVVSKLFDNVKKLNTISGSSGLLGLTKKLLSPMKSLYKSLDNVNFANKTLTQGLSEGITNWSKSLTMSEKFRVSLVGILGLSTSMEGMKNAMKSVSDEGWNLGNSLQAVISGLVGIASGAYIGSIFGPWGTVIGGATGAVLELVSAINGYGTETDKMIEKSKNVRSAIGDYLETLNEQDDALNKSLTSNLALTASHENLVKELKSIVDENGNVKSGYEERANFILSTLSHAYGVEYNLTDGQIEKYQELISEIENVISTKKAEILLNANEQKYASAIQNEIELYVKKTEAESKINDLLSEQERLQNIINNIAPNGDIRKMKIDDIALYNKTVKSLEKVEKELGMWKGTLDEATTKYVDCLDIQFKYSDLQEAVLTGNLDEIDKATKNYTNSYVSENGIVTLTLKQRMEKEFGAKKYITDLYKDASKEKKEIIENSYNSNIQTVIQELVNMSQTVDNLSDDVIDSWGVLSSKSENEFLKNFKVLPEHIQQEIVNKMYDKGYSISSELQKGISKINPTIEINADTNNAQSKIDIFLSKLNQNKFTKTFGTLLSGMFKENGGVYSNGSWKNIPQYENGGAPSHGTLFWAGEAGAEVVAHANGKTEVLNQSQIASAIYSAVYSAMSQFNGGGVAEINVHADKGLIVDTSIEGINQKTRQTGVCPINIPTY